MVWPLRPLPVFRLFQRADQASPAEAIAELIEAGQRIPGVGHTIYRSIDPRYPVLMKRVASAFATTPGLDTVREVENLITDELPQPINVDFALGALIWLGDCKADAGQLFALARTVGWLAHATEELGERPVRFRPKGSYIAPRQPLPEDDDIGDTMTGPSS